ncbi:hypothetical protein EYF80_007454 [Liparis tanakae]|uniref:Uncharacterized protein n=1 Tax=Liparis tanakae TaxID=230148 RepID=A0A4Z2IYR8_9TELE|nr:hypothetical protein EYF80_007454 [Liparis tanakae]
MMGDWPGRLRRACCGCGQSWGDCTCVGIRQHTNHESGMARSAKLSPTTPEVCRIALKLWLLVVMIINQQPSWPLSHFLLLGGHILCKLMLNIFL